MPFVTDIITFPEFSLTVEPTSGTWVVGLNAAANAETKILLGSIPHGILKDSGVYSHSELDYITITLSGDKPDWDSAYTTVMQNSALWTPDGSIDFALRVLSANWEDTYLSYSSISATTNNVNTIVISNSADWANHKDLELRSLSGNFDEWTETYVVVSTTSADWDNNTSILNLSSILWNDVYNNFNNISSTTIDVSTVVENNSAFWAEHATSNPDYGMRSLSSNWEDTYITVGTNSADWGDHRDFGVRSLTGLWDEWTETYAEVSASSANWNSAYLNLNENSGVWDNIASVVNSNSAAWLVDNDTTQDVAVRLLTAGWEDTRSVTEDTSATWNSNYNTVNTNSAQWAVDTDTIYDDTLLQATSADWNDTRTTVNLNSASWDTHTDVSVLSVAWEETYTTYSSNSSTYSDTRTTVNTNSAQWAVDTDTIYDDTLLQATSADWNSNYNTVQSNSAAWGDTATSVPDVAVRNLTAGWTETELAVKSNSAAWSSHTDLTLVQATSADWNDTRTTVNTNSAQWAVDTDTIYDDTALNATSADWNSNYTTVNSNSASWTAHTDLTLVQNASGGWDVIETVVQSNSAQWAIDTDTVYDDTLLQATSADWNDTRTTVNTNSAQWAVDTDTVYDDTAIQNQLDGVETTVNTNSAQWAIDTDTIYDDTALQAASGGWNNIETTVNTNSAQWAVDTDTIYDDTLLQATSADWNDTRTTVNSNSSQWAVDTDTVYDDTAIQNQLDGVETTVNTNSAQWAIDTDTVYDDTLLQATSADWNDTRTTVNTNSATNWLNPTGAQIKSLYEGEANTNAYTNAEQTKVGYISISQNVDLDAIESRVTDLDAAVTLQGTWDASSGSFPSGTTAGHSYIVSVAGTVDSVSFNINDRLISLIDGASTTTYASNWHKADYTDAVLSVAGKIGAVTLDFDDVSETASIKYFTLTLQNNLNSNYTTVNANSAQWAVDTVYDDTAIQAQIDGVETTVNTNSAQWAVDTDTVYDDTALQAASGGWNNIETTVEANSAQWAVDTDTIYDDTAIQNQINGVETTVNTNSAQWAVDTDTVYDDTALQAASGGWNNIETTVEANSAQWAVDTVYDDTAIQAQIDGVETTVNTNSAQWAVDTDTVYDDTALQAASGGWNSTETTVNTNSASWAGGGGGDVSAASNITDNAIVRGDGGTKGVQSSNITIDDAGDTITTSANTLNITSALNGMGLFIGNSVSLLSPSNGTFVDVANAGVTLQDESGPIAYLDSVGFGLGPLGSLSGVQVLAILDEDTMVSNSNAALATQQSIKAYVDSNAVTYNDTALQAASGDWNLNYTTVNNNSADWSDTRTTVNSNSASWAGGGGGSGDAVVRNESQTAHGFAVGDLVYDNAGTWTKAQADDPTTAEVVGIVTTANANDFDLTISGYVSGLTGLTANTLYYLSDSVAGALTTTEPTSNGSVSKPVFWATSTTTGYFINYRGMVVGNVDMLSRNESQTAHGFAVGDVLYDNAGTWTKAQANDPTTADVIGIVAAADTNSFDLAVSGYVTGLAGFTANTLYYLSDSVAGALTTTEPTSNGSVSKPVFWATSTTTGYFINYRGVINNANGAITLNQSQTAHGFIVGDVLYDNAGTWTKAQADDPTTADVIGIVTAANTNDFDLTTSGYVSGLTGLTPNTAYYLSDSTAGGLVIISPTASGTVSKPILWATSSTAGYFINYRGIVNKDNGLTVRNESQTAHGFAVGDLLYDNAGTWTKARADAEATSDVIGIVTTVNTNDFDLTVSGYVSGLSGLTANSAYFLSDTTAGALTLTEPTTEGYVSKPVFWATSTTAGYFTNYRGMVIASALAPQAGDVLQRVVQDYTPSATQQLTTTHADVDGSNYNFTPESASSLIVYEYHFVAANVDAQGIMHIKLVVDGVDEDNSRLTLSNETNNANANAPESFVYTFSSWGTTAKTLKLQAREYAAANEMKLFENPSWDGSVSSIVRDTTLIITEYAT